MRIVLHIGMPKAGSTALQTGLAALRRPLRASGVVYPKSPVIGKKQTLLISGLRAPDYLPRQLRQMYEGRFPDFDRDAEAWFRRLSEAVRARRPAALLLSHEGLFAVKDKGSLQLLDRRLRSLGGPVDVVAYVRRPSDQFISMAQQTLKASHDIRRPQTTSYCATLEGYRKHVADALWVFPYDRTAWPGGDILRHFLDTFVPDVDVPLDQIRREPNESLSAEAMSVLAEYRKVFWPEANARFTPDTRRLIRALIAADADLGGARRPRLHEPVRRFIDHSSTDVLSLRDEYGVVFDGIDYAAVGTPQGHPPAADSVEDLCEVDPERKAELTFRALRHLAEPTG